MATQVARTAEGPPAGYDPASRTFLLTTPTTSYAVRLVGEDGQTSLRHVYWGPQLSLAQVAALPTHPDGWDEVRGEELPGQGGSRFGPPGLVVALDRGVGVARAVEWRYHDHEIDAGQLRITLADRHYPVRLSLSYQVFPDSDVIVRDSELHHPGGEGTVLVERCDSAHWTLPVRSGWRLSQVTGEWSAEFQLARTPLPYGETTVTSRQGATRHQVNPWLMLDPGDATETHGEVWSVALAWSGNWQLTARRTVAEQVSLAAGAVGGAFRLAPGERWRAPACAGLYQRDGFGGTSRAWHAYQRAHVLPAPEELRPVLYNSWEGSWFDVNERDQREVAAIAASLGVELYVMDDGWFGRRTSERAGLGDWWPNPERFPAGLSPLIGEVHRLGMRFGLWVEPEMVNPDSDLYRAHPDWVLHQPDRRRSEVRNQLVLNFARPDVAAWAYQWLDELLTSHEIDFLKWDMNRAFTEAGWPGAADPERLWFDHTHAVYAIIDALRAAHPSVRIETCASGGGRVDLGILARTDQAWTSDNTDPVDRIAIQHGYGQLYPAQTMGAWASESPNPLTRRSAPLRFRFQVAMAGALGISGDLRQWSEPERAEAAELVAAYRRVRPVIQHGELYRLTEPAIEGVTAVQYLAGDEVVVLAWRPVARHGAPVPPVRLAGLDPAAEYALVGAEGRWSGAVLGHHGLPLELPPGDYASALYHLRCVT